jgi:hypothetical protein
LLGELVEGLLAVLHGPDLEPCLLEVAREHVTNHWLVVHDQDLGVHTASMMNLRYCDFLNKRARGQLFRDS